MPKKISEENSKAVAARERKNDKATASKNDKDRAMEDAKWVDNDKGAAKKQSRKKDSEKKRLEAVSKKKEREELLAQENSTASIFLWDMNKTKWCNGFHIKFRQNFAKETFSYDEHLKS